MTLVYGARTAWLFLTKTLFRTDFWGSHNKAVPLCAASSDPPIKGVVYPVLVVPFLQLLAVAL